MKAHSSNDPGIPGGSGSVVLEKKEQEQKPEEPKQWQVFILNDDFTPHFIVLVILRDVFKLSDDKAVRLMQTAERTGRALVGTWTRDIAESKVLEVEKCAIAFEVPFKAVTEQAP